MPTPHRQRMIDAGLAPPLHTVKAERKITKKDAEQLQAKVTKAKKKK